MFVKEKRKTVHYETLSNMFEKPMKLIERFSSLINICLKKSEIGLGFTLGSEELENKDECFIYVRKILDFSPAKYDGRLHVGDRILKINDIDVASMSQTDIVRLIRGLPIGDMIAILVSRNLGDNQENGHSVPISQNPIQPSLCSTNESKMEIFHFIITIKNDIGKISYCHASAGVLGISVECRSTEMRPSSTPQDCDASNQARNSKSTNIQKQFFIKTILKNGSANQDCRLKIGDEILAVQGVDVQNGKTYIIDPHVDIFGDIFHFDLAAVFQKNLEKLNKFAEFKEMFEMNSENPLHALKSLIKEAGDMYSSISIVVRRVVPFVPETRLVDNDLIQKTFKNSKKKINELCRIENIFELNPDYRHHYGEHRTRVNRHKEEEFNEIHGRFHHERFIHHRNSDNFDEVSGIGRNIENFYVDEYEYDKAINESITAGNEELYSYFSKDNEYTDSENPNNIYEQQEASEDYNCDIFEDVDKDCIDQSLCQK